jgi:hypothetical protein
MEARDLQDKVRLGRPEDLYYYSEASLRKQSIGAFQNTQFYVQLNNLSSGNSQIVFSPNEGIGHIIFGAKLREQGGAIDYTGLALPRGWLYDLIDRVSYRVAGSSQYWQTGEQIRIANLMEASNPTCRDNLFALGGAPMTVLGDFAGDNLYAYAYINCPFNSPNAGVQACKPLPTELLNSPLVLSLDLKPLSSIFSSSVVGGNVAGAGSVLESAYFQFQQIMAMDRGDLMKISSDRSQMYSLPCKGFYTQELDVPLATGAGNAGVFNINLVGFQAGQLRSIVCWLTDNADTNPNTAAPFVKNFSAYALPHDLVLTLNGQIIHDFKGTSSVMWGLLNSDVPPQVEATKLTLAGGVITDTPYLSNWVVFPMGQQVEANPHLFVNGRYVSNNILTLRLTVPDPTKSYTLRTTYMYNTVLGMSAGDAQFLF